MEKAGKDMSVRTAVMDGQVLDYQRVERLKDMPTKKELYAKIAIGVKAVPTKIALGVKAVPTKVRLRRHGVACRPWRCPACPSRPAPPWPCRKRSPTVPARSWPAPSASSRSWTRTRRRLSLMSLGRAPARLPSERPATCLWALREPRGTGGWAPIPREPTHHLGEAWPPG